MAEINPLQIPADNIGPEYTKVLDQQRFEERIDRLLNLAAEDEAINPAPTPQPAKPAEKSLSDLVPSPAEAAKGAVGGIAEAPEAIFNAAVETVADFASTMNDMDVALRDKLRAAGFEQDDPLADRFRASAPEFLAGFQENEETTLVGNMVRDVANFSFAMFGPLKKISGGLKAAGLTAKAPKTAKLAGDAIAGTLAEFVTVDTMNNDLKELLDDYPSLRGGVLEFMAGDENDTALDERTRVALVGGPLGVAGDTFFMGIKGLRSAIRTQVQLRSAAKAAEKGGLRTATKAGEREILGPQTTEVEASLSGFDEATTTVRVSNAKAAEKIAKASDDLEARFPDMDPAELKARAAEAASPVEINFDRIDTIEDVEQLMQDATDLDFAAVDKARRGKISNVRTQEAADRLDIGIKEVLSRNIGTPLNAAQTTAYREVWVSAAETVEGFARQARLTGSDLDNYKFRKSLAVFNAVNQSVLGARAEAGRALQSWRIQVSGDAERAQMIGALVENAGRGRVNKRLAENFLNAVDAGWSPGQINAMAERSFLAKTADVVKESAIIGLLWRPATHVVNVTANATRIGMGIAEKGVAARISTEMMTDNGVLLGEASAQLRGTLAAVRAIYTGGADADALRLATAKSVAAAGQKTDVRINSMSAETFGLDSTSGLGKAVEFTGNTITLPAKALSKSDDFFKAVAYAGEVEAQAFRSATREGQLKGWDEDIVATRIAELVSNPPENIRLAAGNAALYSTFTQQAGGAADIMFRIRDVVPLSYMVFPFVKTPANVMRYEFEFSPLAPLVGQWRADVSKGGASRDIALARLAIGSTMSMVFADWAWEGHIQGPTPSEPGVREAMARQGLQANSLRIGDMTFRLDRLSPMGMNLSMTAGLVQVLKTHQIEEEDFPEVSEIAAALAGSLSQSVLDRTFFSSASRLIAAMQYPERRGPRYVQNAAQMLFPFSSAVRTANQLIEPERADIADMGDAMQQMIVGLETKLPRSRNLWGDTIERDIVDIVTPVRVREVEHIPIDAEIVANRIDVQRISRRSSFMGVDVNFREFKEVYEQYVILSGNELKLSGGGAKDTLNKLVKTSAYQRLSHGPDGRRAFQIRRHIRLFRKAAQVAIYSDPQHKYRTEEFRLFREYVDKTRAEQHALLVSSPENIQ